MTKQAFISELKQELAKAPSHIREEILADISEHFTEAIAGGMTEQEVCRNLGSPQSIAEQLFTEYGESPRREQYADDAHSGSIGGVFSEFANLFTGRGRKGHDIDIDQRFLNIRNMDVKMTEGKVRFVPSEDGYARVTIRGRSRYDDFTVAEEGGTLVVRNNTPAVRFEIFNFKSTLETTVYVPAQFAGEIKAGASLGNILASDISGRLDMKASCGSVTIENHRGDYIRARASAGNVSVFMADGKVEEIDVKSSAGSTTVTAQEVNHLRVKSSAGSAKCKVGILHGESTVSSSAGSVDVDINRLCGDTIVSSSAGSARLTVRDVAANIIVSASAGTVHVALPMDANIRIDAKKTGLGSMKCELQGNPNSPYTLRASSSAGSINIKAL